MSFKEIQLEALALPEDKRATLAANLLETLSAPDTEVSDEEVARRDREMDSGAVEPILHEEFVRRVRQERNR